MSDLKILVTGAGGQLASELEHTLPEHVSALFVSEQQLDITDQNAVDRVTADHKPDWIINAAAYTAVDKAEDEPEIAALVNAQGAANLATAAVKHSCRLVQVSTDYVFDGLQPVAYTVDSEPNPLSVYGSTKNDGDQQCLRILGDQALVIRTSWVYSCTGHNFVKTILRLCREKPRLTIVDDQVGTPTWARSLADMVWQAVGQELTGIWHFTDCGIASWYDFAVAIQDIGLELGMLQQPIPILPIHSQDYPQKARRPMFSVLDKSTTWQTLESPPPHWRNALKQMLTECKHV